MDDPTRQSRPTSGTAVWVFALALLAQVPLILNAGYFSHDELQWAALADLSAGPPVALWDWAGLAAFQYRPLTFDLWMRLSRHLFAFPRAFHAVLVAWGAVNAGMLAALARRFGVAAWPAAIGALAFALGPYAVYVHGWVGTLADLIWVSCALLIGLLVVRMPPEAGLLAALASGAITVIALLGKEAAVSIPALLAVAWWFTGRERTWGMALVGSAVVVAVYLALRIDVLLHAPREGAQYAISVANMPLRWVEYQLFPWIPSLLETAPTFARGLTWRVAFATVAWLALLAALWRSAPTWAALFIAGGVAALAPVLGMGGSSNQYAYAFAALTAMVVAAAWSRAPEWGRAIIVAAALLNLWHGVNVMHQIRHVGQVQARFSPALAEAVKESDGPTLRLRMAPNAEQWIFRRLTFKIPRYRGVAIGDRVRLVGDAEPADYLIEADGRLTPLR